jgi:hypothetical protein
MTLWPCLDAQIYADECTFAGKSVVKVHIKMHVVREDVTRCAM